MAKALKIDSQLSRVRGLWLAGVAFKWKGGFVNKETNKGSRQKVSSMQDFDACHRKPVGKVPREMYCRKSLMKKTCNCQTSLELAWEQETAGEVL